MERGWINGQRRGSTIGRGRMGPKRDLTWTCKCERGEREEKEEGRGEKERRRHEKGRRRRTVIENLEACHYC